jgi:hypothetical protein
MRKNHRNEPRYPAISIAKVQNRYRLASRRVLEVFRMTDHSKHFREDLRGPDLGNRIGWFDSGGAKERYPVGVESFRLDISGLVKKRYLERNHGSLFAPNAELVLILALVRF